MHASLSRFEAYNLVQRETYLTIDFSSFLSMQIWKSRKKRRENTEENREVERGRERKRERREEERGLQRHKDQYLIPK